MVQQLKHISVPRPFESGNIMEWLSHFEICAKANGWDAAVKAVKLPILLEGEALAVWLDFTEEEQGDYSVTVDKLKRKCPYRIFIVESISHTKVATWRSAIPFLTRFEAKVATCNSRCYRCS